jgi:RNA polymerase sigma factor (sigma-70 family)
MAASVNWIIPVLYSELIVCTPRIATIAVRCLVQCPHVSHLGRRRCLVCVIGLQTRNDEGLTSLGADDFEAFFRAHYRVVVRLAQSVTGDTQAAQDVAQDVFLAAYRRFGGDYEQAAGWVRVAAVHTALNFLRGERRRDKRQLLVAPGGSLAAPDDVVISRETRAEVRRVLARLPRRTAAVLVMRHGGMSYAEIAQGLGVKVGHVGTLLRRAESALAKEMDRETRS